MTTSCGAPSSSCSLARSLGAVTCCAFCRPLTQSGRTFSSSFLLFAHLFPSAPFELAQLPARCAQLPLRHGGLGLSSAAATKTGHDAHKGCAPHRQGRREAAPLRRQAGRCGGQRPVHIAKAGPGRLARRQRLSWLSAPRERTTGQPRNESRRLGTPWPDKGDTKVVSTASCWPLRQAAGNDFKPPVVDFRLANSCLPDGCCK